LAVLIERAEKADGAERAAAVGGCLRFAEALARSEPERARGIYRQALGAAREEEEKRTALRGLAEVGAPEDLDAIRPLFGAPGLRREAGRAAVSLAARLPPERKAEAAALYRRVLELDVDERTAAQCVRRLRRLGIEVDPAADAGFVTHWWILAPLPNPGGALWEKELSVEKTPAGALDLASEMNLEGRTYGWKHYQTPDPRGLVDMDEAGYGGSERGAYLYAEVTLSREAEALLKIGSDDQVACWLDGAKVHANRSSRGLAPDQDTVPVKLAAGKHRLLLKVLNDGGGWGACLRLAGPDGKPLAFEQRTGP
jgi:hypothetical protein